MATRSDNLWGKLDRIVNVYGGPISMDTFLTIVTKYYYEHRGNIGGTGDFITSPELSGIFGQTLAIALCSYLGQINIKKDIIWVELGPGNGTLFADMWRVVSMMPQYANRVKHVVFVEYSDFMADKQSKIVAQDAPTISRVSSIEKLDKLLDSFTCFEVIIIANEFFDALPIKQYILNDSRWYEILVKIHGKSIELARSEVPTELNLLKADSIKNSAIIELSPARQYAASIIADILGRYHGMVLLIDYGYIASPLKSTIQSVIGHRKLDGPFSFLGDADISSLVDFGALQSFFVGNGLSCVLKKQGDFLKAYGANELLKKSYGKLMKDGDTKAAEDLLSNTNILLDNDKMGGIFHVLQIENL